MKMRPQAIGHRRTAAGPFVTNLLLTMHAACFMAVCAHADVVERRGGESALHGEITKLDDGGVTVNGATFVPWDRVRDVQMDRPDPALQRYLKLAENLWRARTRVERNDLALAEPILERLFAQYRGKTNDMALVVSEGLLRCRLARGANDAAVMPALEAARLRNRKFTAYAAAAPVIDAAMNLCPLRPPALEKLERELEQYDAQGDIAVSAIASLYRRAVRQHLGMSVKQDAKPLAAEHPGVKLLSLMVELSSSDLAAREAARKAAARDVANLPSWAAAWSHYFIATSMLMDESPLEYESAMVHLAHLPARYASQQPYLTGLALARMSSECEKTGDSAAAATLFNELTTLFPRHPVLKQIAPKKPGTTTTAPAREAGDLHSPAVAG
jgi:hypothetical protein